MIRDLDCYAATTKISCFFSFFLARLPKMLPPFLLQVKTTKPSLEEKKRHSIFVQNLHNFVKFLKQNLLRRKQKKTWQAIHSRGDSKADRQYCNLAKHKNREGKPQ